jgi:hypothetical protein
MSLSDGIIKFNNKKLNLKTIRFKIACINKHHQDIYNYISNKLLNKINLKIK